MTWLILLISLTYLFTVGYNSTYKERILELKEKNENDKGYFANEINVLLLKINTLEIELKSIKGEL